MFCNTCLLLLSTIHCVCHYEIRKVYCSVLCCNYFIMRCSYFCIAYILQILDAVHVIALRKFLHHFLNHIQPCLFMYTISKSSLYLFTYLFDNKTVTIQK